MSEQTKGRKKKGNAKADLAAAAAAASAASAQGGYDPATLLSLYSMQYAGLGGGAGAAGFNMPGVAAAVSSTASSSASTSSPSSSLGTLGVAASQAASLGANQSSAWWNMASQLAAQDYLARFQQAAAAQQQQQQHISNYEQLFKSASATTATTSAATLSSPSMFDSLRLPSDTEIIKYTSSSTGPKIPGTSNRGRKKTISLDPSPAVAAVLAATAAAAANNLSRSPAIPPGLTIERKKTSSGGSSGGGRKSSLSGDMVDRVEITKVPVSVGNGDAGFTVPAVSVPYYSFPRSTDDSVSITTMSAAAAAAAAGVGVDGPLNLSLKSATSATGVSAASAISDYLSRTGNDKIPSEYYASQALSGVFLAEQIRQQQLAAALENRLSYSNDSASAQMNSAIQAALLMNKLKAAGAGATASETSRLLAIAAAAAQQASYSTPTSSRAGSRKSKKTTVASMLKERSKLTPEEIEMAENSVHPELTIEPIFRHLQPNASAETFEDGKLKIKNIGGDTAEIRNLSDQELQDLSGAHAAAGTDDDMDNAKASRYATVETAELRLPLKAGWRRETLVREYSKSGVRGDVCYYAPCSKKFKQYPDIIRYLEKNGFNDLGREHFSFSTKVFIGDFLKPTGVMMENGEEKYASLNEREMLEDVDKIRSENGWKPRKISIDSKPSASGSSKKKDKGQQQYQQDQQDDEQLDQHQLTQFMPPEQKMLARLQAEVTLKHQVLQQQEEQRLQKETLRILREAERLQKIDIIRRDRESKQRELFEVKRQRQEEVTRQKQEEHIKRMQEREMKKQQAAHLKEQFVADVGNQQNAIFQASMERERRRQHMILMKQLEGKRRNDDRERRRKEFGVEKERERDRRIEQKNLEIEIIHEMRKPVEDMSLPVEELKPMPEGLKRIEGLLLSGEAFANVLMVFEFLHNFGERLGFDMDSLPTLSELQAAFLNDPEAEEELLSVVIHLLVCAIEDPGIPTQHKHLTLLGQTLRQADITNTNVSEILRIYLIARGQYEVRLLHNVTPPETHHPKDKHKEIPFCQKRMDEYNRLLKKTRAYEMSLWCKDKNFLCLNPTEKAEILAYVCNELLYNKAVMHQIECFMEKCSKTKKITVIVEARLKKQKLIHQKKFRIQQQILMHNSAMLAQNADETNASMQSNNTTNEANKENNENDNTEDKNSDEEEDDASVMSDSTNDGTPKKGAKGKKKAGAKRGRKPKKKGKAKAAPPPPPPEESEEEEFDEADLEGLEEDDGEDDEKLSQEDLQKKIEKTVKQLAMVRDESVFANNCLRANDLGQDRYRRRYWHMAHAGGLMVEGMESCEPWKMSREGMPHEAGKKRERQVSEDDGEESGEEEQVDEEISFRKKPKLEDKIRASRDEMEEEEEEIDDDEENKENGDIIMKEEKMESEEEKKKRIETEEVLKKLGSEILVTPKVEVNEELKPFTPKITPNGDKLNLFNHSACFNMSLSPVVLNGSVTITPKAEYKGLGEIMPGYGAQSSGYGAQSSSLPTTPLLPPNAVSTPLMAPPPLPYPQNAEPRPWFSILSIGGPFELSAKFEEFKRETMSEMEDKTKALLQAVEPVDPQVAMLELKLEGIRKTNVAKERRPIPKAFQRGWWRATDPNVVVEIEKNLHVRGAREQLLLSNVRRGMEFCHEDSIGGSSKKPLAEDLVFDELEDLEEDIVMLEGNAPPPDRPKKWSREVALRVDKYVLEQVEALEDKVASASMQVPTWRVPNKGDLETRAFRPSCEVRRGPKDDRADPVAEARERLLDLEANIERRYLKAPLGVSNAEVSLKTITSSTVSASNTPTNRRMTNTSLNISKEKHHSDSVKENGDNDHENSKDDDEKEGKNDEDHDDDDEGADEPSSPSKGGKEQLPRGLVTWREGVRKAKTAAQLAMGFYVLETSIAWHKSIMKAYCQLCHSGDDEDSLLLCDGCDKGYHMYCFKPSLITVPDGDWYCFECINKAAGVKHCLVCGKLEGKNLVACSSCPRAYHTDCLSPSLSKVPRGKWQCPGCNQKGNKKKIPKKLKIKFSPNDDDDSNTKDSTTSSSANGVVDKDADKEDEDSRPPPEKKAKREPETEKEKASPTSSSSSSNATSLNKKKAMSKTAIDKDLTPCRILVGEMENSDDSWPFLFPVNTKQFPTYKKIVKNPMDIATIKKRLSDKTYKTREDFCADVRVIFDNCEVFNEDDSPVGKAGYAMKNLFCTRWSELISMDNMDAAIAK